MVILEQMDLVILLAKLRKTIKQEFNDADGKYRLYGLRRPDGYDSKLEVKLRYFYLSLLR